MLCKCLGCFQLILSFSLAQRFKCESCKPKLCDYPKSISLQPRGNAGCSIRRTTRFSPSSACQVQSAWVLNKEDTQCHETVQDFNPFQPPQVTLFQWPNNNRNECLIKLSTQSFALSYYPRSTKWQREGIWIKGRVNFIYFTKIK